MVNLGSRYEDGRSFLTLANRHVLLIVRQWGNHDVPKHWVQWPSDLPWVQGHINSRTCSWWEHEFDSKISLAMNRDMLSRRYNFLSASCR